MKGPQSLLAPQLVHIMLDCFENQSSFHKLNSKTMMVKTQGDYCYREAIKILVFKKVNICIHTKIYVYNLKLFMFLIKHYYTVPSMPFIYP